MNMAIRDAVHGDEQYIVELIRELADTLNCSSDVTEEAAGKFLSFPGCGVLLAFYKEKPVRNWW